MVSSSSSDTSGKLAGKPTSIHLARRLCQAVGRAAKAGRGDLAEGLDDLWQK